MADRHLTQKLRTNLQITQLEDRVVPAVTSAGDVYQVRSGDLVQTFNFEPFFNDGVLANDIDTSPDPDTNLTLIAPTFTRPIFVDTGEEVSTPFNFFDDGGFDFRIPKGFEGQITFTYFAQSTFDGAVGAETTVIFNVTDFERRIAVGADAGGAPRVQLFDQFGENEIFNIMAYDDSFRGGVRVATGDFNGDGIDDIVTVPGFGGGPHVKIFNGVTSALITQFGVFDGNFLGGLNVATGDVNNDGITDIIIGAEAGGGPRITVVDGATFGVIADFFAFDPSFTGGVRVATGDFDDNFEDEILVAAASGGGPHVKVFDFNAGNGKFSETQSFFAGDPTDTRGIHVAAGDFNRDYVDDIVVSTASGLADVRIYDGQTLQQIQQFTQGTASSLQAFGNSYPGNSTQIQDSLVGARTAISVTPGSLQQNVPFSFPGQIQANVGGAPGGVRVAAGYTNGRDDFAELIVVGGIGAAPRISIVDGKSFETDTDNLVRDFTAFESIFFGGMFVATRNT